MSTRPQRRAVSEAPRPFRSFVRKEVIVKHPQPCYVNTAYIQFSGNKLKTDYTTSSQAIGNFPPTIRYHTGLYAKDYIGDKKIHSRVSNNPLSITEKNLTKAAQNMEKKQRKALKKQQQEEEMDANRRMAMSCPVEGTNNGMGFDTAPERECEAYAGRQPNDGMYNSNRFDIGTTAATAGIKGTTMKPSSNGINSTESPVYSKKLVKSITNRFFDTTYRRTFGQGVPVSPVYKQRWDTLKRPYTAGMLYTSPKDPEMDMTSPALGNTLPAAVRMRTADMSGRNSSQRFSQTIPVGTVINGSTNNDYYNAGENNGIMRQSSTQPLAPINSSTTDSGMNRNSEMVNTATQNDESKPGTPMRNGKFNTEKFSWTGINEYDQRPMSEYSRRVRIAADKVERSRGSTFNYDHMAQTARIYTQKNDLLRTDKYTTTKQFYHDYAPHVALNSTVPYTLRNGRFANTYSRCASAIPTHSIRNTTIRVGTPQEQARMCECAE